MFSGAPANFARAPSFFTTSTGTTPRSKGLDVAILISSGVAAKVMSTLWPVAFSKRGPSSFRLAVIEPPASTFRSDARALVLGAMAAIARPSSVAAIESLSIVAPRYCKGIWQGSLLRGGVFEETRITPQQPDRFAKGFSHARDDDRYSSFNFTQHCCYGPGPEPAVPEPDDASAGIGRHGKSAGTGRPPSTDGALAAALSAQRRGRQTGARSV